MMKKSLSKVQQQAPGPAGVTVSIGLAVMVENDTADSLLQRADRAQYRAKKDGRNLVRV